MDHRPVTFVVKATFKLKELRRRVAKSLFFSQTAVQEAKLKYENGVDEIISKIDNCSTEQEEEETQKILRDVEHFITGPWERIIQRPPKETTMVEP